MKIKVKKEFTIENKYFPEDKEIELSEISYTDLIKANENGFIEPLTRKQIMEIKEIYQNSKKEVRNGR